MPRYKLTLEYDGTDYSGWQRQDNGPSVQQAVETALEKLTGAAHRIQGAGRTDAGVHALGQVAHVDLAGEWAAWKLREALNAHLVGASVAVLEASMVDAAFDARRSATRRRYLYRLSNRRAPLALERDRAWHVKRKLDVRAMHEAAQTLIGKHDFSTFRDSQCQADSPVRTLDLFSVERVGETIAFHVEALSFLHRQVRSMVGSLAEVGLGKWSVADMRDALAAADRRRCGPVAPACGLYLEAVRYGEVGAMAQDGA
jgi:tRNA pseudouridine38-40 synthase